MVNLIFFDQTIFHPSIRPFTLHCRSSPKSSTFWNFEIFNLGRTSCQGYADYFGFAALELFQQPDSFGRVGVGAEHDVRLGHPAGEFHVVVEFLVGMYYVELRHVAAVNGIEAGVIRNLLQGGSERPRVAAEFGAAGIGHVFAGARNGKAREPAENVANRAPNQNKNQRKDDDDTTAATAAPAAGMVAGAAEHCRKQLHRHHLNGRKDSHEHDAHHHESRVAVLDVREFMPNDSGEFRIV